MKRMLLFICIVAGSASLAAMSVVLPIAMSRNVGFEHLIKQYGIGGLGDPMMPLQTLMSFLVSGIVIGIVAKRYWLFAVFVLVAFFPCVVLFEVFADKGHHNLFPFEILVYIVVASPGFISAMLSRLISRKLGERG
jgi:hypothetical protein